MASELSQFIEDELRKQGINDDEEQRLLSNLRVKPLSVQATGAPASRGWSTKQKVALGMGLAVLFGGLMALVITYRGHPSTTGEFRGAMVDPEAGVEFLPISERGQQRKGDVDAEAPSKAQPQPPKEAAPEGAAAKGAAQALADLEDYSEGGEEEDAEADVEAQQAAAVAAAAAAKLKKKQEKDKADEAAAAVKAAADKAAADKAAADKAAAVKAAADKAAAAAAPKPKEAAKPAGKEEEAPEGAGKGEGPDYSDYDEAEPAAAAKAKEAAAAAAKKEAAAGGGRRRRQLRSNLLHSRG